MDNSLIPVSFPEAEVWFFDNHSSKDIHGFFEHLFFIV